MRFKRRGKKLLSDLSEISHQLHTFGRASSYDNDDDEDNKCQEQEGGEDVAQRQEKVVPLLRQDDGDDSRWFSLSCLWAIEEWQQSAFLFICSSSFPSQTNRCVITWFTDVVNKTGASIWTDITPVVSVTLFFVLDSVPAKDLEGKEKNPHRFLLLLVFCVYTIKTRSPCWYIWWHGSHETTFFFFSSYTCCTTFPAVRHAKHVMEVRNN